MSRKKAGGKQPQRVEPGEGGEGGGTVDAVWIAMVKHRLVDLDLEQKDLARLARVGTGSISRLLRKRTGWSIATAVAGALGLPDPGKVDYAARELRLLQAGKRMAAIAPVRLDAAIAWMEAFCAAEEQRRAFFGIETKDPEDDE